MANRSKAQLIARAKTLGLKVGDDWTRRQIEDAIEIAETEDDVQQEDTEKTLGEVGTSVDPEIPEATASDPIRETPPLVASEPTPTVPTLPSTPITPPISRTVPEYNPSRPRIGAGRYHVLWTVTLPGGSVDRGIVNLDDAQAISLVKQGAVVHVDDYEAYLKYNASTQPVAKPQTHPTKIPSGAGRYRTIGGVMKNGCEIPHGTVAEFTAVEVASLTKPGMIAIEYPD